MKAVYNGFRQPEIIRLSVSFLYAGIEQRLLNKKTPSQGNKPCQANQ